MSSTTPNPFSSISSTRNVPNFIRVRDSAAPTQSYLSSIPRANSSAGVIPVSGLIHWNRNHVRMWLSVSSSLSSPGMWGALCLFSAICAAYLFFAHWLQGCMKSVMSGCRSIGEWRVAAAIKRSRAGFSPQGRGIDLNNLDLGRDPARTGDAGPPGGVGRRFSQSPARMKGGAGGRKSAGRRNRPKPAYSSAGLPGLAGVPAQRRASPYRHAAAAAFRISASHLLYARISMPAASAGVLPPIPPCGLMKLWWIMATWNIGESSPFAPRADPNRSANSPLGRSRVSVSHTMFRMWVSRMRGPQAAWRPGTTRHLRSGRPRPVGRRPET